jgi:uncharacterized protein
MKLEVFEKSLTLPVAAERLWDWHTRPGAFERLAPAWQLLETARESPPLSDGAELSFRLRAGLLRIPWTARIGPLEPPYRFVDTQVGGPFRHWRHEHLFEALKPGRSRLTDRVEYALPGGLGRVAPLRKRARGELERLFRFRHRRMAADLERFPGALPGEGRTILISGSRGLIGGRLVPYLRTLGYGVRGLTRGPGGGALYHWDPARGELDPEALRGVDAVVHLAGEGIAAGRWTAARKARILGSRVDGTRALVDAMAGMDPRPAAFICASGVNFYGSGSSQRDESAPAGDGFLAEVCRAWEQQALRAREYGARVVCLRTGVVLDPLGGALGKLLPVFRIALGGPVGSGAQGFPWIGMDDLLDIYERAIRDPGMAGPVNAVHPDPVTQGTFSRTLGAVLRRPAFLTLPAFAVRAIFGQMGEETLLADLTIRPEALTRAGFAWRDASLQSALAFMLGRE